MNTRTRLIRAAHRVMPHPRREPEGERGQILVIAAVGFIVILAFASMVVDLGVLRNTRQNLVNTLDAAALAAGTKLPVDGSATASPSGQVATITSLINNTIQENYPGLPTSAYSITYNCLVGVDPSTNAAWVSRDVPATCDPHNAVGAVDAAHVTAGSFTGAGPTRYSPCNPGAGDKCNVVYITGGATTPFSFGPVVGVNSGSTGSVVSVACNGPCGASPIVPVDLVIILDRTASMAGNDALGINKIASLQSAAKAVLSVYDPSKQRVALGLTGPSKVDATGKPVASSCGASTAYGVADDNNFTPLTTLAAAITSTTATTVKIGATYSAPLPASGSFSITVDSEQMMVTSGAGTTTWTVNRGINGTTKATHASGAQVAVTDGWITPYGTTTIAQAGTWMPVGLSGTDPTSVRAIPSPSGAAGTYSTGGVVNANSDIVKAINCISAVSQGTNLATAVTMAQWYLDTYGRPGITQGIILETDGHPQYGFNTTNQINTNASFTCKAAADAAAAAKADTTNSPKGIQIFTVGYGASGNCPIYTSSLSAQNGTYNMYEGADATGFNWSGVAATTLLSKMATDASHFYNNPASTDLAKVFKQAAVTLAGGGAHLIQLCPAPIVNSVSPTTWAAPPPNTSVTISGQYFTGATSVTFGGIPAASYSVTGDTTITATPASGTGGVSVTTVCGTN